ncbi:MAG: caspase family protein [Saprospiraceae bacterium]|nr:caspase family protein [Saprospiraceae bacterium]
MMNLRKYYIIAGLLLCAMNAIAQDNVKLLANWEYKRKPARYEKINKVISTTNGFIVAVGETSGDRFEDTDGLFILLNGVDGSLVQWRPINKPGNQAFNSVIQNHDGTFTLVGYDEIKKGDRDGWVVDVDFDGELINRETLRGLGGHDDEIYDLAINHLGTVLIAGAQDIGKTNEFWLLAKGLDGTTGALSSHLTVPGLVKQIIALPDGSFAMVGSTDIKDREHQNQVWVAKISAEGRDLWGGIKYFGDKGWQEGISICPSPVDGGLVIAGVTNSKGAGDLDMWLIKVDDRGDLIWDRTFGGANADRAASVTALSEGGYAILGHTWSHMPRASTSILKVVAVNNDGEMLDDATYPIPGGRGNQLGYSIAESLSSTEVIYAGNSSSDKGSASQTWISGLTYKSPIDLASIKSDDDTYGTVSSSNMEIKTTTFYDADDSKYLQEGERGFVEVNVVNTSLETMSNVKAMVSSNEKSDIKFWDQVYLGSLQAGQEKKLRIPVEATGNLSKSSYQLNINLQVNGMSAASTQAKITSNRPDPATLIVNKHSFAPGSNAEAGKPITLTLEIANTGGLNSESVPAAFNIPTGVESLKNEKINIPALAPQQTHMITFEFAYSEVFANNSIKIEFESEGKGNLPSLRQSFNYGVANNKPIVEYVATPTNNMDIIWTSHDLNEFRTVDVNQREVNIKAIALANKELSKRNFAVLINGRRAQGQKLDESRLTPPENAIVGRMQQSYTDIINLQEGENEVQVVYYDDSGEVLGKSTPLIFNYISKDAPNLYVLSIGVQHEDLQFTVNDATKFAGMYSKLRDDKGRAFRKVSVLEMTKKEETTEKNIKRAFLNLTRNNAIKDNDLVVVFISSHGKVAEGNRYVLLPSDYDPQYEELSTIDFSEDILKKLRSIDGNKLLFIDACHSGSAGSRSFSDGAASKMMNDLIQATAGMEIFASCADNEFSYEDESWGNGAFTKAIIEAFNNETVEIDGKKVNADVFAEVNGVKDHGSDGVITIEELKLYVQKRVPYLVNSVKKKMQNPVNKSTDLLPLDMGIYLVN